MPKTYIQGIIMMYVGMRELERKVKKTEIQLGIEPRLRPSEVPSFNL